MQQRCFAVPPCTLDSHSVARGQARGHGTHLPAACCWSASCWSAAAWTHGQSPSAEPAGQHGRGGSTARPVRPAPQQQGCARPPAAGAAGWRGTQGSAAEGAGQRGAAQQGSCPGGEAGGHLRAGRHCGGRLHCMGVCMRPLRHQPPGVHRACTQRRRTVMGEAARCRLPVAGRCHLAVARMQACPICAVRAAARRHPIR